MNTGLPCIAAAAGLLTASASAHHSPAMFDQKLLTLEGTVREFQWTNPHSYIQLRVQDGGHEDEWSIETGAPMYLQMAGWKPSTLKAGDRITVVIAPLRRMPKNKGGLLVKA